MSDSKLLKVLFIGDVVGDSGCDYITKHLNNIKFKNNIQLVIANGENSAIGNGITPSCAEQLLNSGVDVITTGNHCFRRHEILDYFDSGKPIIRPINLGDSVSGKGFIMIDLGYCSVCVVNLMGRALMTPIDNPFTEIDKFLNKVSTQNIIVDFHAETTSEKKAMGFYLAKRVSAVIGTHTHVQTADEVILDEHTAYITDVGMCGSSNSVLGVKTDIIIQNFINYTHHRHEFEKENIKLNGAIITLDYRTGKSVCIERISI